MGTEERGSFTASSSTLYWWFQYSDLLESGNSDGVYCLGAGKHLKNRGSGTGWNLYTDSHNSSLTTYYWYTNYHWTAGYNYTATYTGTYACMMYNYNYDSHSETVRGRLGIQGAIWADNRYGYSGLDDSHARSAGFSSRAEFDTEYDFYNIEANADIQIIDVVGKTLSVNPDEGLLPGEEIYVYLNFPIIFGSVPSGTTTVASNGVGYTTTYKGEFGIIEITNGTLIEVPSNKAISADGKYRYTIKINTGDLSSNKVEIKVTKIYYDYLVNIAYTVCVNGSDVQPVGVDTGTHNRSGYNIGVTVETYFKINSNVSINHYIESIGGGDAGQEQFYKSGSSVASGSRKDWTASTKFSQPAVGELGDTIIYKIEIINYTKANVYVDVASTIGTNVMSLEVLSSSNSGVTFFDSSTGTAVRNDAIWDRVKVTQSSDGTTPITVTLTIQGKIQSYNTAGNDTVASGSTSTCGIYYVYATSGDKSHIMKNVAKSRFGRIEEDSDYFITKKYNISVDQYISEVDHQLSRNGITETCSTATTYKDAGRAKWSSNSRSSDPVYVEYGDVVTYTLVLYNTNYDVTNSSSPYYTPGEVYVDFTFTLPDKYTYLSCLISNSGSSSHSSSNKQVDFSNVKIDRNSTTTIIVTLKAEAVTKNTTETTNMSINTVYNRNWIPTYNSPNTNIENLSSRTSISETYKISSYNATLQEYVYTYNAEMAKYNNQYEFTYNESEGVYNNGTGGGSGGTTYDYVNPLEVEKYETLCYKTIVTNQYTSAEAESDSGSYKEYNTRFRPTIVTTTIDYGLTQYAYEIHWVHNGTDIVIGTDTDQSKVKQTLTDTGSKWVYTYEIINEDVILSPGDYIYYLSYVEVTESNLSLNNLGFQSDVTLATNINRKDSGSSRKYPNDTREVTSENVQVYESNRIAYVAGQTTEYSVYSLENGSQINTQTNHNVNGYSNKTTYSNYVRLKDLVVSGTVWVDDNRDGYQDDNETGKNDVTVRLYSNYYDGSYHDNSFRCIDTVITYSNGQTGENGYYTFGRVQKAAVDGNGNYSYYNNGNSTAYGDQIQYYVEFEYDGETYKATEVYGGISSGEADGTGNISTSNDGTNSSLISYWRQGYSGLPTSISEATINGKELGLDGLTEYKTDSNAYEFDNVRNQFDEYNETIGFGRTYGLDRYTTQYQGTSLDYSKSGHIATLIEYTPNTNTSYSEDSTNSVSYYNSDTESADDTRLVTARSFITQSYSNEVIGDNWSSTNTTDSSVHSVETNYIKTGNDTNTLSLYGYSYSNSYNYPRSANGDSGTNKTAYTSIVETEYLKFINLGLVTREDVDLSLEADVYTVDTIINGEEMTYEYNENQVDSTEYDGTQENEYHLGSSYMLDLYTSDYYYRADEYYIESADSSTINTSDFYSDEDGAILTYKTKIDTNYTETAEESGETDDYCFETNDLGEGKSEQCYDSELEVQVTYRVRIHNNEITNDEPYVQSGVDIPVEAAINELTVYYDENFITASNSDEIHVKEKDEDTGLLSDVTRNVSSITYETSNGATGSLTIYDTDDGTSNTDETRYSALYENSATTYTNQKLYTFGEDTTDETTYKVMYLRGMDDVYLAEGEYVDIYITLTVDKDDERNLKISEDGDLGLELIAEISAYTTKYADNYYHTGLAGEKAALVDKDSEPGNVLEYDLDSSNRDFRTYANYEDDTYKTGIKIGLLDGRDDEAFDKDPDPEEDDDENSNQSQDYKNNSTERVISGIVWEDELTTTVEEESGLAEDLSDSEGQPIGNGEQDNINEDDGEQGVEGVLVSLIEVIQTDDGTYYEYPARYTHDVTTINSDGDFVLIHKKGELIETRTASDGSYTLDHFIPGYYKIRFDYGDSYTVYELDSDGNVVYTTNTSTDEYGNIVYDNCEKVVDEEIVYNTTYNGQDYKSTTYYNQVGETDATLVYYNEDDGLYVTDYIGSNSNNEYFDQVKTTIEEENYSDAEDDEIRRLNVNSYSETMTALQALVFSEKETYAEKLTKNTHMYAETAIFYAKPEELSSSDMDIAPTSYANENGEDFNECRLWKIENLDFGLAYRPESSILLDKEITTLSIITSDNNTLVKLYFEEDDDGNRIITDDSIGAENVQYLANTEKDTQGFVYINMDTDILEGATITAEYEMTATDAGDVDRINENLDNIKYECDAEDEEYYSFMVYVTHNANGSDDIEYTYNANATSAELLSYYYYKGYSYDTTTGSESYTYLKRLKKPYISDNGDTTIKYYLTDEDSGNKTEMKVVLNGTEYYGMYLGEAYYTGKEGKYDIEATVKVDHILDYVDNDFTFSTTENSTTDQLWEATTSAELWSADTLIQRYVNTVTVEEDDEEQTYLIDRFGIQYDTDNRSNLALSVNSNKLGNSNEGNISLSRFLNTTASIDLEEGDEETYGTISIVASKVLSADDLSEGTGLSYENISEVVQFTTVTGRRTTLPDAENGSGSVIGNANVSTNWNGYEIYEDDTDATEVITISPPTGLEE